ncbi:MAG: YceG family protein [Defluviitaleaceae bacterium]|nr:YceG family protein [Defluviitaleaceae bacterium]
MQFNIQPFPISASNWEEAFNKPLPEREGYTQVAGLILGTPWDVFTYKEFLYNMVYDRDDVQVFTSGSLDKHIDNKRFQEIQQLMNFHRENKNMSINRFIAFIDGKSLLPLKEHTYYDHLRSMYTQLLKTFESRHQGLFHQDLSRVLTDTIKWSWTYLKDFTNKIIWYGDATKSEVYFLYFLMLLGLDVLVFHPEGKNIFSPALEGIEISIQSYPNTLALEPLPTSKPMREATVAKKASAELEQMLHQDGTYLFKPWQFRDYSPHSITLHTTYDEVRLISEAKAFIRPSFEVKNETVYVPVLFSKICGVSKDRVDYAHRYRDLVESELTIDVHKFPFSDDVKGYHRFHFQKMLVNGTLDSNKLIKADWWKYGHLPKGLQIGLVSAISRYVKKAHLKKATNEDIELYLFSQALEIPANILQILQQYDYSQTVPKFVIFNDGKSGEFSRSDAARILLLNELGMDIILFNPTGQRDLELHVDSGLFDSHWLEDISFEESHQQQLDLSCRVTRNKKAVKSFFNKLVSK